MTANLLKYIFPKSLWNRRFTIAFIGSFATILAFDLLWSMATSFRALSFPATYIFGATLALLMALPATICRRKLPMAVILIIADSLAIANLMYCRTYFGPIPPASYLLAGNVAEFGDAIRHSLRLADVAFAIITIATLWQMPKKQHTTKTPATTSSNNNLFLKWLSTFGVSVIICYLCALLNGGIFQHIEHLKSECYYRATPPVVYTLPISTFADLLESNREISDKEIAEAQNWLTDNEKIAHQHTDTLTRRYTPENIVMIIVESLESWPLGKTIEGAEITPNLNRLMADTTTVWYASRVLSQVGPGRSIDGQLLMTAGLLPMNDYVYSMRFPNQTYPHLAQAFRCNLNTKSYLLSGDRATTWNQGAVAQSFGIDEVRFRDQWDSSESFGHPRNPSDGSFLRQVATKLKEGEIWDEHENAFLEVITYSSHFPFTIPAEHRKISLAGEYLAPLGDYITAINYTDNALGEFIDYLQSRPDASKTMVVIVGDHEALASWREPIRNSSVDLANLIDAESFVPMIILNSPISGRYNDVMGQVDVYSTILDLVGIQPTDPQQECDIFPGMGISALSSSAPRFATDINGRVVGDTVGISTDILRHISTSYSVSSTIIRADLLH